MTRLSLAYVEYFVLLSTVAEAPNARSSTQPSLIVISVNTHPPFTHPKRVLIVEDHRIVQDGLRAILGAYPAEFRIIGTAETSQQAVKLAAKEKPDLVLLDYFLGDGGDGCYMISDLMEQSPTTRILVLSLSQESEIAERAIRAGARGYVMKFHGADILLKAARTVLSGLLYASPELLTLLLDGKTSDDTDPKDKAKAVKSLSNRQRQIFQLLGCGLSVRDIAKRIGRVPKTVSAHCENLKNKLGCSTVRELRVLAKAWLTRPKSDRAEVPDIVSR